MLQLLALSSLLLTVGCPMADPPKRPPDLTITYQWKEASLPPPDHYEYTIRLGPGDTGSIELWPDYPAPATPRWTETFEIAERDLVELHGLISTSEVEADATDREVNVGGTVESLEATWGDRTVRPRLSGDGGRRLREAVRTLVPEEIWNALMQRREEYARRSGGD
jgi:hypothetical protein